MPEKRRKSSAKTAKQEHAPAIDLNRLEFFRHGFALMPDATDPYPAIAYSVAAVDGYAGQRFCTCRSTGAKTCDHLKSLSKAVATFQKQWSGGNGVQVFSTGHWYRLARFFAEGCRNTPGTVQFLTTSQDQAGKLIITDGANRTLVTYLSEGEDRTRLVDRCRPSNGEGLVPTRADVLVQLAQVTMTDDERILRDKGLKTARQTLEGKFWYRFAYHCFKEFGEDGCALNPGIEEKTGEFFLSGMDVKGKTVFLIPVPRKKVKHLLGELKGALSNQHGLNVEPLSLDSVFDVTLNEGMELEIQPLLRMIQQSGEHRFFKREDLKTYQYGDLYYIKELGMLVEDQYPKAPPKFVDPVNKVIQRSRIPGFLSEHAEDLQKEMFRIDERVKQMKIMTVYDRIEISTRAIERDWCWLSVDYSDGSQKISLAEIIRARRENQRFVATQEGWVDCHAPAFKSLDELSGIETGGIDTAHANELRLSRADVFRLNALSVGAFSFRGDKTQSDVLRQLLDFKPIADLPVLKGMRSSLRDYQLKGVQWLWFLYENRLGGLLCDDMGLGKTHQVMAFFVALREAGKSGKPFLVICPTSVISHWESKIREHAPGITAAAYYGLQRNLDETLAVADVLITSYGILRRDIKELQRLSFTVVVFDEVQNIKNADTQAYQAAVLLEAEMKIGVTGTPIENRLDEIKALMDLALPGYLGADQSFRDNYQIPIEQNNDDICKRRLTRILSPFSLRRLKKTVLHELPEKIEDLRTCRLSQDQIKLYREVIEQKGRDLRLKLSRADSTVPYMHVFALLNMLKQICNHPAQVEKDPTGFGKYSSGKWDLFSELLNECLDSGQKVVVYSQYVGMIDIITHYLTQQQVDFVTLTGASRNRGHIIERFDQDPDCRVFVGSLKAGGVGIDLVAASVVIHYDRWWNAAREDQATDRVHRIGQKRGVQVFKLITEGTLEEKIAAIIARKKDLMDSIVKEDDPSLVKIFTREELLEMLSMPQGA